MDIIPNQNSPLSEREGPIANSHWLKLTASVFTHSHDGILITDPLGHILEINDSFCEITGYTRQEVIGKTPAILRSGLHDAGFYRNLWQAIERQGFWRGEIFNRRKNGEILAELLTISAVGDDSGEIIHYVGIFADISELKNTQRELEQLAHYDQLTNVLNRSLLVDRMAQLMALARRCGNLAAICYLDIDSFKTINDEYGHPVGDRVLVVIAERIRQQIRGGDTIARVGGDEFALLLTGVESLDEIDAILQRILAAIAAPIPLDNNNGNLSVTASIGVSIYPHDGADPDTLMRCADKAMYKAKKAGRACWQIYDADQHKRLDVQRDMAVELSQAMERGEFVLYFQPKVSLLDGKVLGVETLLRWQHPRQGLLAPAQFLPLFSDSLLAPQIDRWVIESALEQMTRWQDQGVILPVSLNISDRLLKRVRLENWLAEILAAYPRIDPALLELEISEPTVLSEFVRTSRALSTRGIPRVSFAIDRFGSGQISLNTLRQFQPNTLKIDRALIENMATDRVSHSVVEGILGMSRAFACSAVAVGIETPAQSRRIAQLGCMVAQGFGLCPPLPAEALLDRIQRGSCIGNEWLLNGKA